MKKILKKNQIIITALVVMVAIAGYLSMTDREELTMNITCRKTIYCAPAPERSVFRRARP